MAEPVHVVLPSRGAIALTGPDARSFLQGLVSNDVTRVAKDRAIYAAFLTAQGKFLHDFFLIELDDALIIDCEGQRLADLKKRLGLYKLRSKIALEDASQRFVIAAAPGAEALARLGLSEEPGRAVALDGGVAFVDPRLAAMGARFVLPREGAEAALAATGLAAGTVDGYERLRLELGLPDGSRDLEVEKSILLENGFDELNGVDWKKGCYMGQELTARTKYRGLIKKRLMPVEIDGPLPAPGTPVLLGQQEAGELRSGQGNRALALLRLEQVEQAKSSGAPLTAGDARIKPVRPAWAGF
ncbi:MAG: folate-binding protein YgfZ [Alphaproteobacteria bacterium]|nr:folate-binding protein YgfZ [Alphaproteobacteria bacterium]